MNVTLITPRHSPSLASAAATLRPMAMIAGSFTISPLLTSPAVVDIIDPKALYVSAPMDEVDASRVQVGQAVKITIDLCVIEQQRAVV